MRKPFIVALSLASFYGFVFGGEEYFDTGNFWMALKMGAFWFAVLAGLLCGGFVIVAKTAKFLRGKLPRRLS